MYPSERVELLGEIETSQLREAELSGERSKLTDNRYVPHELGNRKDNKSSERLKV